MYRDITLINIFGLRGTLYIDTQPGAQAVRVHSTGRYEDKKVPGNQLLVLPGAGPSCKSGLGWRIGPGPCGSIADHGSRCGRGRSSGSPVLLGWR